MAEVATLDILIKADASKAQANISALQSRLEALNNAYGNGTSKSREYAAQTDQLAAKAQRSANSQLQLAQAQARLQATQGNLASAERTLQQALENTTASELRQISAATQLAQVQNRLSGASQALTPQLTGIRGAIESLKTASGGLTAALGPLGVAFGAQQVISFGIEAGKSALELDKAERILKAITGSTSAYNEALAVAEQQQRLFGGSLAENINGLTGLAITAKQSGAELEQLVDLSQRLGTLDPAQGVAGARIALSEALSGDPTSLARRYEIPRAALAKLRDESISASERLRVVDEYLTKIGITSKTTAGAISDQAKAYNALGVELGKLRDNVGGGLNAIFAPLAGGLSQEVQQINLITQALDGTKQGFIDAVVAGTRLSTAFKFDPVSEAALRGTLTAISNSIGLTDRVAQSNENLSTAQQQSAQTALQKAQADIQAATAGQLYVDSQGAAIIATQESANAATVATAAQEQYNAQMALMEAQTRLAAQGVLALNPNITESGIASLVASGKISAAVGQYIAMTIATANARAELARLQIQAGAQAAFKGTGSQLNSDLVQTRGQQQAANNAKANQRYAEYVKAQRDGILVTGSAAEKQAEYNRRVQEATSRYGEQSAEAERARTALEAFEQSQDKAGRKGKGAKGVKLSDQQKLNNSLYLDQQKADDKLEDAANDHAKKLLDIQADYAKKVLRAERDLQQSRASNNRSFYQNLTSIEDQGLRKSLSVQYEQAALQAEQVAREKGADVAKAYLDAERARIEDEGKLQDQINKAKKDKNYSEAEYLEGVKKLAEKENQAKVDAALNGDDTIAQQRDQALADEEQRYQEQQDSIATSAERSGQRRVTAAQLAGKAIDSEAQSVKNLGDAYDRVSNKRPVSTPPDATGTATSGDAGATDTKGNSLNELLGAANGLLAQINQAVQDNTNVTKSTGNQIASAVKTRAVS